MTRSLVSEIRTLYDVYIGPDMGQKQTIINLYNQNFDFAISLKENENTDYVNLNKIKQELDKSKKIFKKNQWPIIDVTRKSVEETAASVIKIYEIKNKKNA